MSERWPTKQYPSIKPDRGIATVKVGKSTVRVAFESDPENVYEVPLDKAPEMIKNGKWMVSMGGKHDRIFSISPISGMFKMRFREFSHAQGQIPAPIHRTSTFTNQDGSTGVSEYDAFTALFEIIEGPNKGMIVAAFLRYNFSEVDGFVAFTKPKSRYTKELGDVMDACGAFDKGPMKYSENILPALQSRLQAANYPLAVIMKDGFIDSMTRLEIHEEAPKGKPAKKVKEQSTPEIMKDLGFDEEEKPF